MEDFLTNLSIDKITFIKMLVIILFGGLIRGYAGFGFSLATAPLLGLILDPIIFVPCMFIFNLIGGAQQSLKVWRDVNWKTVVFLSLAAFIAMPFGTMALKFLSAQSIKLAIGVIVLLAVFGLYKEFKFKKKPHPIFTFLAGALSGVLNTSTSMNGPPAIIYFLASSSDKTSRASLVLFFLISAIVGLGFSFSGGVADQNSVILALITCPGLIIGNAIGNWYFEKSNGSGYRKFALILLSIIGAVSIIGNLL